MTTFQLHVYMRPIPSYAQSTSFRFASTLWLKVERPLIFTDLIARNQKVGLSTFHTRGQSPKAVALRNAYMVVLFD